MADINGVVFTGSGTRGITYTVAYTGSRPNNSQMTYDFSISAAMTSGFLDTDYALLCIITVNGVAGQVRIKAGNEFWYASTIRSGNISITCPSTVGITTQPVRFQVISDGTVVSPGVVDNSSYTVTSSPLILGEPTSLYLRYPVAEGTEYLIWSGATSQPGNTIESYEFQSSDSPDNEAWGNWVNYNTVNSTSGSGELIIGLPSIRGYYRRFQIRVRGSAGAGYYSPWKVSSNSVRKNILATPPSSFTARPEVYAGNQVTLEWSGAIPGTSTIRHYIIQESLSYNQQITWSDWQTVATVVSSATSGSTIITATTVPGVFTRYRISVYDSMGGISAYVTSNVVFRHANPLAPFLEAPKTNSITYNTRPMYLIQTQASPGDAEQTIYVFSANGYWLNSVDNPECFSESGTSVDSVKTIFTEPEEVSPGNHVIEVQCRDQFANSPSVSRSFTLMPSPFAEIIPSETHVKAAHVLTLRVAINNLRNYYSLSAYIWSREIVPGRTQVRDWPIHILELRAAVQGIVDKINSFDSMAMGAILAPIGWLPLGTGRPRADAMNQMTDLVLKL